MKRRFVTRVTTANSGQSRRTATLIYRRRVTPKRDVHEQVQIILGCNLLSGPGAGSGGGPPILE